MVRKRITVSIREEVFEGIKKNRGPMSLSRYVDMVLGTALGIDEPSIFEMTTIMPLRLTDYIDKE